jgi:large subunit ribosomal protein L13
MSTAAPARKNDQRSYLAKTGELEQAWHIVDAENLVLGRLSAKVAQILQGKHKPTYTPHVDTGDFVVVINAEKLRVTGEKRKTLTYQTYSGYPSGQRTYTFDDMQTRAPHKILELSVRRMLPKSKLGRQMLSKLKVYKGSAHPHAAQQPKPLTLDLH